MSKINIVEKPITDLIAAEYNPRKLSEEQRQTISDSIKRFGLVDPILVNIHPDRKNIIIGGHQRIKVARELGFETVPCVELELNLEQEKELNVRLNKNTGEFDFSLLQEHFEESELIEWGFTESEMDWDFGEDEEDVEVEEDDFDGEPPEEPKTELGRIYQLGEHRLMCGDSTKEEDVNRLMNGELADMVHTDPPYNIASDSKNFASDVSKSMDDLKNSDWDVDFEIEKPLKIIQDNSKEDCTFYVWTNHFLFNRIIESLKETCDHVSFCVWAKPNPMPSLSKRHWTWNTELCVYGSRGGIKRIVNFPKNGHALSSWDVVKKSDGSHPTQKPIELCIKPIEFSSNQGSIVLDLFGGSGSTLIACEQTKRKARLMELDPKYCDVIVERYCKLKGIDSEKVFETGVAE